MEYVIISDLHIAGDNSLAIFHAQSQLAAFLRSLDAAPTTLIINGDSLDFLAVPPFPPKEVFSGAAALAKVRAIIQTPANEPLWAGFQDFLKLHPDNRIAVLLGNHDVEVAFPAVQAALRGALSGEGAGGRVEFVTDTVSYPDLQVGGVPVRVEHGFQYDPYNWYNHDHLRAAAGLATSSAEFVLPYGSRFVYDVLNHLTPAHPFVPLLKPEPGVFWVMQALAPSDAARLARAGVFGLQPHRLINRFKMWLRGTMFAPGEMSVDRAAGAPMLENQLLNMVCQPDVGAATQRSLRAFLQADEDDNLAFGFIDNALQRGQYALLRLALGWLQQDRAAFFDHRNTRGDDFQRGIDDIHRQGYRVAVLGHSHARKMDWLAPSQAAPGDRGLLYLNTGTWADLLDPDLAALQDDDALTQWLDQMREGRFERKLVLTYTRLAPTPEGLRATLEEWRDGKGVVVQEANVAHH